MRHTQNVIRTTSLIALLVFGLACSKKTEDTGSTDGGSGGGLFSASDIVKSWNSGCLAGVDPITGGNRIKYTLSLYSNGNFSYDATYYTGGACNGGTYLTVYNTSGTYSVGGATTGGQTINFVANASDVMPMATAAQSPLYSVCTNTLNDLASPYGNLSTPSSGLNGHHFNTYMAACTSQTFPNSSNRNISNVATYSNSVLTIGAPDFAIPGVFPGGTVPSSATIQLF